MAQRQLELGLEESEWRTELVARVGDEAPLAREPGFEPAEHGVQRLAQPTDLVAGLRQRQPLTCSLARDLRRLPPHRLHGSQRCSREQVPGQSDSTSATGPTTKSWVRRPARASSRSSSEAPATITKVSPSCTAGLRAAGMANRPVKAAPEGTELPPPLPL